MTKSSNDILQDRYAIQHIIGDYSIEEAQALLWAMLGELHYTLCKRHPELKNVYKQTMVDSLSLIIRGITK